ncbi:MAG: tetratricopeptide repeat protein [candidate division KSB1 bacterium]|nr:tetratricopeptide repeat protein [candidate division KSB1 bacterium]
MARLYERGNRYEQAAELYVRICRADPDNLAAYEGAKRTLIHIERYKELESLIYYLQQKKPGLRYKVDLASLKFERDGPEKALQSWNSVLQSHANRQEVYMLVGRAMVDYHFLNQALEVYKKGRSRFDDPTLFMFNMASIYKAQDNFKELTREYIQYLEQHPQQINYLRSDLKHSARSPEDQKTVLTVLESHADDKWAIHLWCADFNTMLRNFKKAFSHLIRFENLAQKSDQVTFLNRYQLGSELYDLGSTVLSAGDTDKAIEIFQYLIDHFKGSFAEKSRIQLAKAYSGSGRYEKAVQMLKQYAQNNRGTSKAVNAMMNLGDLCFKALFDLEQAMQAYKNVVRYANDQNQAKQARYKLGECAVVKGDLPLAESYFKSIPLNDSEKPEPRALYKLAELAFYRQKPGKVSEYIQALLESDLNRHQSLVNDVLEMQLLVQKTVQDSTSLSVLGKASLLYRQLQYSACVDTLERFISNVPGTPLRDEILLLSADALVQLQREEQAIDKLKAVYNNKEGMYSDKALYEMANIHSRQDESEQALQLYEKFLYEYPQSIYLDNVRERLRNLEIKS